MDTLLRWNFNVWNNCRAFLFPSSDIQFYHFMKHVTTMGKKHIMLTFDMLDWDADGEIGFEEFYMMVCILLSSEVRHSLTKHDHIKNSPSTLTTTIQGSQYLSKKASSSFWCCRKNPFTAKFPLSLSLLLFYERLSHVLNCVCVRSTMWKRPSSVTISSLSLSCWIWTVAKPSTWKSLRHPDSFSTSRVPISKRSWTCLTSLGTRYRCHTTTSAA